jgi:hypothetical protein
LTRLLTLTALALVLLAQPAQAAGPCHAVSGTREAVVAYGAEYRFFQNGSFNSYSGQIDWGDGQSTPISGGSGEWTHLYGAPGVYTLRVTGSGSYGDPPQSCSDDATFTIYVQPAARLGSVDARPEGDAGTTAVDVPVRLHPGSAGREVAVRWRTAEGSAAAGSDYVEDSGTARFGADATSAVIRVDVKGDALDEEGESFEVRIVGADGATIDEAFRATRVAIADDDEDAGGEPGGGGGGDSPTCPGLERAAGNHVIGTPGADRLRGTPGRDVICGLGGDDTLRAGRGGDVVLGGLGDDALAGDRGQDVVLGGLADDRLDGGPGRRDRCRGGLGRDERRRCESR